ncbi:MAG: hypothetical protein GXO76_14515 [Calditrichaeota bacterium]|nr:hypothetical protein [Calditrichota bacterium]
MLSNRSDAILEQISRTNKSDSKALSQPKDAYIAFRIFNEYFALPIQNVRYSMPIGKITPVPDVPRFLLGITNVMGEIISVVDIFDFIFQKPLPLDQQKCFLLLIKWKDIDTSFVVSDLMDMLLFEKSEIQSDLLPLSKEKRRYFVGGAFWEGKIIGVLNLENILASERMRFGED